MKSATGKGRGVSKTKIGVVCIVSGIVVVALFLLLEGFGGPMVLVNRYTPLFALITGINVTALVCFFRRKK